MVKPTESTTATLTERCGGRLCFTTSFDRAYIAGARGLVRSIRRLYAPGEAAIVMFAEEFLYGLKEFCDANSAELHYSHQIPQWALPLIYKHEEYRNDTKHYYHPDFKPNPEFPCDMTRSSVGFDRIRHLHPVNVKAHSTGYCLNVRQFEWVVHIDADAFLLGKIDDLLAEMEPDTVFGFDDKPDELNNLEALYGVPKPAGFSPTQYGFNAGVVFYRNGEAVRKLMLDFMHFMESCHHFLYSGCFGDQGVLRALVAKHHILKRIHYELKDATNWNPTWGRADHLRFLPETSEWINELNSKPQRIWHGAGPKKVWTSQYDAESARLAWQSIGGEIVTRRWIEVVGSLIEENCLAMCELIRRYNPSSTKLKILEFGTQYGRTAIAMCCALAEHDVRVHVDTCDIFAPSSDYPVGYPRQKVVLQNVAAFGLSGQIESHHVGMNENLIRRFEGQSFDVVFIDANHQFKQVLADCVISKHLVKKGGLIIGDDWQIPDVRDAARLIFGPDQLSPLGCNMWFTVNSQ